MHRFLRHLGWTDWDQMIGIRADEQRRVSKIRARGHSTESSHETMCMPLADAGVTVRDVSAFRSEEHTSELQSLMRISYAVFCLKKKKKKQPSTTNNMLTK